ncbi:MAG: HAMP domain-containing protein, partial [Gammaproteobacteria bacterium]
MSIGQKLWSAFGLTLAFAAVLAVNMLSGVNSIEKDVIYVEKDVQPAMTSSMNLSKSLEESASALGFYLLSKDNRYKDKFSESILDIEKEMHNLSILSSVNDNQTATLLMAEITKDLNVLKSQEEKLLELATNDSKNFPARAYAATEQGPLTQKILQNLRVMLDAEPATEDASTKQSIFRATADLRYSWMTIFNNIRAFLAFRTDVSLQEIAVHKQNAGQLIKKLRRYEDDLDFEQEDALSEIESLSEKYFVTLDKLVEMHKSEQWRTDSWLIQSEIGPAISSIDSSISKLVDLQLSSIHSANENVSGIISSKRTQFFILSGVLGGLIAGMAWLLTRMISRPLNQAVEVAERIANGDLSSEIDVTSRDETGQLLEAFSKMQASLKDQIESEKKVNRSTMRIKSALDMVSAGVMMAD